MHHLNRIVAAAIAALGLDAGVAHAEACRAYDESNKVELDGDPLEAAIYDADRKCLVLFFLDDSIYGYTDVPRSVYRELLEARGAGRYRAGVYFNESIRPAFRFERLSGSPPLRPAYVAPPEISLRGDVDCFDPDTARKRPVRSEAIDAVSYDPQMRCLVVHFDQGQVYGYADVPAATYSALVGSAEPGVFFYESIWGKYRYQRLR
jgi:hypothetical protein